MPLHKDTFEYLKPTPLQLSDMAEVRSFTAGYAEFLGQVLPDGPDKTYLLRKLREVHMWAMIAITRNADGSPLED
jgi:hypothetical protein